MMKRQMAIILSVALVSFFIGTLFSMGSTASGLLPNIFENNVNELSSPQTIRFQKPDEIFIPSEPTNPSNYHTLEVATFTWTPKDSLNNVILSAYYWAEFKWPSNRSWVSVDRRLTINSAESDIQRDNYGNSVGNISYLFSPIKCWMSNMLLPSSTYTIQFRITIATADSA